MEAGAAAVVVRRVGAALNLDACAGGAGIAGEEIARGSASTRYLPHPT